MNCHSPRGFRFNPPRRSSAASRSRAMQGHFLNFFKGSINGTTLAFYAVDNLHTSDLRHSSTSRPPNLAHHVLCTPDQPTMATPLPLGPPQASIAASDATAWPFNPSYSSSNALFARASRPPSDDVGASGERNRLDPSPPSFRQEVALGPLDGGRRIFGCREVKMTVVRAVVPRRRIYLRARLSHESLSTFNFLRPQAFVERGVARFTRHEGETTVDLRRDSSEAECCGIESGEWG